MVITKMPNGPFCRLVWYFEGRAERSWDKEWQQFDRVRLEDFVEFSKRDRMFMRIFQRFLPRAGRILEGGCGLGQWVLILDHMGYQIEGIDISELVIQKIRRFYPSLCVSAGNILSLDYPDHYFSAYISLGVVEHFAEGPERALQEAHRILKPGGILLCSVPYFNFLRKISVRSLLPSQGLIFYQWGFTQGEFGQILERNGFRVKAAIPYAVVKTLKDLLSKPASVSSDARETGASGSLGSSGAWSRTVKHIARNYVLNIPALRRISGHMILFVGETLK